MILHAKARPVRIRIKSGGEEHSSVESLKKNFNVEDLIPLVIDGRLYRWLKQKKADAIVQRLDLLKENISGSESKNLSENHYIQFVASFFAEEFNFTLPKSKREVLDMLSLTQYSNCSECLVLQKEFEKEIAKEKKTKEDSSMRSDYNYAVSLYQKNSNSRLNEEWIQIFECHKDHQSKNPDYNWIMYTLTETKDYLKSAASLGHPEAKRLIEEAANRFKHADELLFSNFFNILCQYDLYYASNLRLCIDQVKSIPAQFDIDIKIKKDIKTILQAWNNFDKNTSDSWLQKIEFLDAEANFIAGIFAEYHHKDSTSYFNPYIEIFVPSKAKMEFILGNKTYCSLCANKRNGVSRYLKISKLQEDDNSYREIAQTINFIITNLFDKYDYVLR